MPFPPRVVLATHNPGKLAEFGALTAGLATVFVSAPRLGLVPPEEISATYLGNADLKARAASAATGLPALADDTGLEVSAMADGPGVHTADFAAKHGGWPAALEAISTATGLREAGADVRAVAVCALVLVIPGRPAIVARARVQGRLGWPPRADLPGFAAIFETTAGPPFCEAGILLHRRRAFEELRERV